MDSSQCVPFFFSFVLFPAGSASTLQGERQQFGGSVGMDNVTKSSNAPIPHSIRP